MTIAPSAGNAPSTIIYLAAGHIDLTDPVFQALLAELGLLAVIIFLLAWSMRLLSGRSRTPG